MSNAGRNSGTSSPKRGGGSSSRSSGRNGQKGRSSQQRGGSPSNGGRRTGGPQGGGREADPRTPGRGLGGKQVEGRQAVRELLMAEKRKIYDIFISAELEGDAGVSDIAEIARAQRVPLTYIARAKIERETRSEAPQGVMALAAELEEADLGELLRTRNGVKPFLVAVDGVTDPGNLGAIIRNCDGAGVTGVLLPKHRAVHVTPTVAKASAGAIEHMPIALVPGLPAMLTQLKDHGIWIVGLDDAVDRDLFELESLADEPICLVLGSEGDGLSRLVRQRCDSIVAIPMRGRVSSLNVSAAAALATYEITRGRRPSAD